MIERFRPWRHVRGQVVVAAESGWERFERQARRGEAIIVEVPGVDFFEADAAPLVTADRDELSTCHGCNRWGVNHFCEPCDCGTAKSERVPRRTTLSDVRARVFAIIDDHPEAKFFVSTERLEDVVSLTVPVSKAVWAKRFAGVDVLSGDVEFTPEQRSGLCRSNLILGTTVRTRAEAGQRVPKLLQLRDLCGGLWVHCEPAAAISFRWAAWCPIPFNAETGVTDELDGLRMLNYLSIVGSDKPLHPDWVRLLVRQGKDAGVQVAFWGWGEWLPQSENPHQPKEYAFLVRGKFTKTLSDTDTAKEVMGFGHVGPKRSGRTLDGKTYEWHFDNQ